MSVTEVFVPPKVTPDGWEYRDHDPESDTSFYAEVDGEYEVVVTLTAFNEYDVALEGGNGNPILDAQEEVLSVEGVPYHAAVATALGMMQGAPYFEQAYLEGQDAE